MLINSPNISGSLTVTGNIIATGSLTVLGGITGAITGSATSASYASNAELLDGKDSSIFATTGSNGFNGNQSITGSLTVTGQVVAQTLNVQQVTSSIVYSSGSNIFGNELSNTQQFTGSVGVTGSLTVAGAGTFSSSVEVGGTSLIRWGLDDGTSNARAWGIRNGYNTSGDLVVLSSSTNNTTLNTIQLQITRAGAATFNNSITIGESRALNWGERGGISQDGSYNFNWSTNGIANAFHLQSSTGNVGIGTTSPKAKLQIRGSVSSEKKYDGREDGLILYYPFSENTGTTTVDRSQTGANGTLTNGPTWASGIFGYGVTLDGSNDYVSVASPDSSISLGTTMTYAMWIYPTSTTDTRYYLFDPRGDGSSGGTNSYFLFDRVNSTTVNFTTGNSGLEVISGNVTMGVNQWFHVAATRSGNTWRIYLNGVQITSGTTNTTSLTLSNSFRIGTYSSAGVGPLYYFAGTLDEARMYNRTLTANEVMTLYLEGVGTSAPYTNASGNVGIGTASPEHKLDVRSPSGNTNVIRSNATITGDGQQAIFAASAIWSGTERGVSLAIYKHSAITNPASYVSFFGGGSTFRFTFIDDSGVLRISENSSDIGTYGGTVVGTQTSDIRLKNVKDEFNYGLNEILQINPIAFTFKKDENQVEKLGFSAQEMINIIPESVYDTGNCVDGYEDTDDPMVKIPNSEDTILAMDYTVIIPVLVKAIQELKSENDTLKSRIDTLEQA